MPTLVIDNVPVSLFDQIQRLAKAQKKTAADTALAALGEGVSHHDADVRRSAVAAGAVFDGGNLRAVQHSEAGRQTFPRRARRRDFADGS